MPTLLCSSQPRIHLLHLSFQISMEGLSNSPATAPYSSVGVASRNEAVMAVSSDNCSTIQRSLSFFFGSASGLPATKFTASRRQVSHQQQSTVASTSLCRSSAIPVTRQNRLDTVRDGRAQPSSRSSQNRSPSCTVRSISQSPLRSNCSNLTD